MSSVRIPSQQSTILAGREIPFHGDGVSPRISFNAPGEAVAAGTDFVFTSSANNGGTLVFSLRREELAWDILWDVFTEQKTSFVRPKASGICVDSSNPDRIQIVVWDDAVFTSLPDFGMGVSSEVVTFTLALSGVAKVKQ